MDEDVCGDQSNLAPTLIMISAHTFAKVERTCPLTEACPTRSHTTISFFLASTTVNCVLPVLIGTPSKVLPPPLYDMRSENQGGY